MKAIMNLCIFILVALASATRATRGALREKQQPVAKFEPSSHDISRKLGEKVTINREFNEEGNLPVGRQVQVSVEEPVEEPDGVAETLEKPSGDDEEEDNQGNRDLTVWGMNCADCWWHCYYGWITRCCGHVRCDYYYC